MGSPKEEQEREDDEFQHEVALSPFRMHRHPVTNAQYELFDPAHAAERWGKFKPHPAGEAAANHPVVFVNWYQAWSFAKWTDNHLPSEAQWEYSSRGGADFYQVFHYGNSLSSHQANFDGNYPYGEARTGPYLECTTPVGQYEANAYGLYDMHGNVWEWCADWYDEAFYRTKRAVQNNPRNRRGASARVLRGGSWFSSGGSCRSAYRLSYEPDDRRSNYFGFRLAAVPASLEPSTASQEAERRERSRT